MLIGVPRETLGHEYRVGLNPFAVNKLVASGHEVIVEQGAGAAARFHDADYTTAGARVVYAREEVLGRADLVAGVARLELEDIPLLRQGAVVCGFQHLAVAPRSVIEAFLERQVTLLGYELIEDDWGDYPILHAFSEIAGQMVLQVAAQHLQNHRGGRGILLGSLPSVAPPTVLILGAGRVGYSAAMRALQMGVHVIVIDSNPHSLRAVHAESNGQIVTAVAGIARLERYTSIADVVIGAVHIPGGRAPFIVNEEMVRGMKEGSIILDLSIDQGGCVETSRPTSLADPTFLVHGVLHYCVPNMTACVARTASRALAGESLPYLTTILQEGVESAFMSDPGLANGVGIYRGQVTSERVAAQLHIPGRHIEELIGEEGIR